LRNEKIKQIHAVIFVAKQKEGALTIGEKFLIQKLQEFLGRGFERNCFLFLTNSPLGETLPY